MPLNLDEEFKLYSTNAEREKYDNQATLYSIILSLEYLERAYVRDSITQAQ
ncbi:Vacuolar protein-sorting-associated protein 28 [Puccinia graminis f. sp. tritici]|nr:Vacuolar protein-sorting-associated protein 28 [Puccinia graminis f. sp. tritici]